jgi:hypothetical protein
MEKLLVAHVERLFVVEARIEPSTFRPVVQRFTHIAILCWFGATVKSVRRSPWGPEVGG